MIDSIRTVVRQCIELCRSELKWQSELKSSEKYSTRTVFWAPGAADSTVRKDVCEKRQETPSAFPRLLQRCRAFNTQTGYGKITMRPTRVSTKAVIFTCGQHATG